MTFMFLIVIFGTTHERAPVGFAGLAIGLALTLIHLISIPVTNTSVNPARSTGPALFVGGWALQQLWLFWVAHAGAALAGFTHKNDLRRAGPTDNRKFSSSVARFRNEQNRREHDRRTSPLGRSPKAERRPGRMGPLSQRTAMGHGARGLQRGRRRLELTSPTISRARAPIGGVKTASPDSPMTSSGCASRSPVERQGPILKERLFGLTNAKATTART